MIISRTSHNKGFVSEKTLEIIQLALKGKKINEISHKLKLPYTTVSDIVRKYTKVKRVLIKEIKRKLPPKDQLKIDFEKRGNDAK